MSNLLQWTKEDEERLMRHWNMASKRQLMMMFPDRTWKSITAKAARLELRGKQTKGKPRRGLPWTVEERKIVKEHYGRLHTKAIQLRYLPNRSLSSIQGQARRLGLTDEKKIRVSRCDIIKQLRQERILCGLSRKEVATRAGYEEHCIAEWERGKNQITIPKLIDWAQALGFDVVLIPREE